MITGSPEFLHPAPHEAVLFVAQQRCSSNLTALKPSKKKLASLVKQREVRARGEGLRQPWHGVGWLAGTAGWLDKVQKGDLGR